MSNIYIDAYQSVHTKPEEAVEASQQFEDNAGRASPTGGNCDQKAEDATGDKVK